MKYQIDKLDREILSYLMKDARIPFAEIAKKLIVSPGTVQGRVKKMENAGLIKGTNLLIDYSLLGYGFTGYVGIITHETSQWSDITTILESIPEITLAHLPTGGFSIFCKILCRDTRHARSVIDQINRIPGVLRTDSTISLEESFNSKDRLLRQILEL
ncbi:MAG: Lrp/AsnC family transcriptional regulator [Salibacteraceae bacterium]